MPSTTIQTRISAFEALSDTSLRPSSKPLSPPSSPPQNGRAKSASDILETPLSPITAASLQPVALFTRPSPSPSPPNLGRKSSLVDLKDWVVDDGPFPNRPNGLIDSTKTPTQPAFNTQLHAASVNPKFNGTPLISLESPPKPKPKPKPANLSAPFKQPTPPQLPPRKSSYTSLKSVASSSSSPPSRRTDSLTVEHAHRYPPLSLDLDPRSKNLSNHAPSSSVSSFHSVSLSSDTDPSTPGSVTNFIATFPIDTESGPSRVNRRNGDADSVSSLTESYEEVSASSFASPTTERLLTMDWESAIGKWKQAPPKLPERPNSTRNSARSTPPPSHPVSRTGSGSIPNSPISRPTLSTTSSSNTLATTYTPRRSAPPPPSRSSDRSSIRSNTTTHSYSSGSQILIPPSAVSLNAKRPTPVPLGVRRRYEAVFSANITQRRKVEKRKSDEKLALLSPGGVRGRRAVGWRGLSVDLITGDDMVTSQQQQDDKVDEVVGNEEKLEGAIVKLIWSRSGLDKERLAEIWNECDLRGQGALSLDAFVKGMWRIDEELRRARAHAIKSATSSPGNYRPKAARPTPKVSQRPRDILR